MAKAKIKPELQQPSEDIEAEEKRREDAERSAHGLQDGRKLKRSRRQYQIGIKTTPEHKKKFDRFQRLTDWTYSDIFEYCLEAGEEKYAREKQQ